MSVEQLSLFGPNDAPAVRQLCDYFMLLSPPATTKKEVVAMKKALNKTIRIGDKNLLSVPHISLYRLEIPENDELVVGKLQRALGHLYAFTVRLSGAEYFVHGARKSLVLKIENPEPLRMIHAIISSEFRPSKGFTPHLTIARNIPGKNAEKINLEDFHLYDAFLCDQITILKKTVDEDHFSVLLEIPLRQY